MTRPDFADGWSDVTRVRIPAARVLNNPTDVAFSDRECRSVSQGSDVASVSPTTGDVVRLYNPRRDNWNEHFQINGPLIVPITEIAEATARLLRFNDDDRVFERAMLQLAGRFTRKAVRADVIGPREHAVLPCCVRFRLSHVNISRQWSH